MMIHVIGRIILTDQLSHSGCLTTGVVAQLARRYRCVHKLARKANTERNSRPWGDLCVAVEAVVQYRLKKKDV